MTQLVDTRPIPSPVSTAGSRRRVPTALPGTALALALLAVGQLAVLGGLWLLYPRFFFVDDRIAQYLPMYHWMGRHLAEGRLPPLLVPELGMSGNLAADLQYGVLDPAHWAMSWLVFSVGDLNTASWLLTALAVVPLGAGTVLLLRSHRVRPAWAACAGLAATTSGCLLYVGAAWWPLMWGTAWLPWLWLGLRTRGARGPLLTAGAAWLLAGSGYPYTLPFAALVVLTVLAEEVRAAGWASTVRATWPRLLGGAAGVLAALPGLLTAAQMQAVSLRAIADPGPVGNAGGTVANGFDALFGSATLLPLGVGWQGGAGLTIVPIMALLPGALALLPFVDWPAVRRTPGLLPAGALVAVGLLATQLPDYVGSFRVAFRYLVVFQVFVPVAVALLARDGLVVTRRRVATSAGLLLLLLAFATMRAPLLAGWHLLAAVLSAAVVSGLVVLARDSGGGAPVRRPLATLAALAGTALSPVLGLAVAEDAAERFGAPPSAPVQSVAVGYLWGTDPAAYRARLLDTDDAATVLRWGNSPDLGWDDGALMGNGSLLGDLLPGYGYTSVGQAPWAARWCQNYLGAVAVCTHYDRSSPGNGDRTVGTLLEVESTTGRPWIDLLTSGRVVISGNAPAPVVAHFQSTWTSLGEPAPGWLEFRRTGGLPDQVSGSPGVRVEPGEPGAWASLRVTSGAGGAVDYAMPWWPGFRASLDGVPLQVTSLEETTVRVLVPPGASGELRLEFAPWPARLLPAALAAGALLAAGAAVMAGRSARREAGGPHPTGEAHGVTRQRAGRRRSVGAVRTAADTTAGASQRDRSTSTCTTRTQFRTSDVPC